MNQFRQGEHICAIYETQDEQRAVAAEYLAEGLRRGERCYYVADSPGALRKLRDALRDLGIDIDRAMQTGAYVEATHADAHLAEGCFDSERMLGLLNRAVEAALNDGYTGLRTCGDMSWLLAEPPGASQVVEYEALLNPFFEGQRACGMCQYDRRRVSAALIDHALTTHPSVVAGGVHARNPLYKTRGAAKT